MAEATATVAKRRGGCGNTGALVKGRKGGKARLGRNERRGGSQRRRRAHASVYTILGNNFNANEKFSLSLSRRTINNRDKGFMASCGKQLP